jgi:hypothetical protein
VVDGNPLMEEEATGGGVLLGAMAGGSSLKVLLHLQRKMAVRFLGSDGDGVGWVGARQRSKRRAQARQSGSERLKQHGRRSRKGREPSTTPPPPSTG